MKNFALKIVSTFVIMVVLWLAFASSGKAQTLTQVPITEQQWETLNSPLTNPQQISGFFAAVEDGDPNPNIYELGLGLPYSTSETVDVTGGWNWGTPYQYTLSNDLGDGYRLTVSQGSSVFQTAIFSPTVPYADLIVMVNTDNFPQASLVVSDLTLTLNGVQHSLGTLAGGNTEPQLSQGFILDGAGENWTSLTGTLTLSAGLASSGLAPSNGDLRFTVSGAVQQAVPEPSVSELLTAGIILLASLAEYRRTRENKRLNLTG